MSSAPISSINASISADPSGSFSQTGLNPSVSTIPNAEVSTVVQQKSVELNSTSLEETQKAPCPTNSTHVIIQNAEIKGQKHLHLGEKFTDPIQQMFKEPVKLEGESLEAKKAASQKMLNALVAAKFIDQEGNIIQDSDARKAHIKGKVFIDSNGEIDYKISGRCGDKAVAFMQKFKDTVDGIKEGNTDLKNLDLNINPQLVAKPSQSDLEALRHGGQMQYRTLPNGDIVKLLVDPGENGEGDGLTISIFNRDLGNPKVESPKIPLNVVFEGAEYGGDKARALKDGKSLLSNWRERQLFERSQIKQEYSMYLPGVSRFDRLVNDNTDDLNRIQAQNDIWNAINEYLKLTGKSTEQVFEVGPRAPNSSKGGEAVDSVGQKEMKFTEDPIEIEKPNVQASVRDSKISRGVSPNISAINLNNVEEPERHKSTNQGPSFNFSDLEAEEDSIDLDALAREAVIDENSLRNIKNRNSIRAQARPAKKGSNFWAQLGGINQQVDDLLKKINSGLIDDKIPGQLERNLNATLDIVDKVNDPKLNNEFKHIRAKLRTKTSGKNNYRDLLDAAQKLSSAMSGLLKSMKNDINEESSVVPPLQNVGSLRTENDVNQKGI